MINLIICYTFPLFFGSGIGSTFYEKNVNDTKSAYTLVAFFNTTDCDVCLNEIESFNRIATEINENNINVVGVLNSKDQQEILKFTTKNKIKFKMVVSTKIFSRYDLDEEKTPFFILVSNLNDHKIIYQSYAKKQASSQKATFDIVNMIVRNQD